MSKFNYQVNLRQFVIAIGVIGLSVETDANTHEMNQGAAGVGPNEIAIRCSGYYPGHIFAKVLSALVDNKL